MIVATRAAHAQTEKRLARVHHDLIQRILPREALGNVIRSNLPRQQHRRRDEKSRGRVLVQSVTGDLLADEAVIRRVVIERLDHVVAIRPGVRTLGVDLEAVRVRVTHDIQPVLRPALAVARRLQQLLHDAREGIATPIFDKGRHLLRRRRQADEIERHPSQPRHPIRLRRGLQSFLLQPRENEAVHIVARPPLVHGVRRYRARHGLERPVLAPVLQPHEIHAIRPQCAFINPPSQRRNLRHRQTLTLGRHPLSVVLARHKADQRTAFCRPRDDVWRMLVAALERRHLDVEPQTRFLPLLPVALVAVLFENRSHLAHEVHRSGEGIERHQ